MLITIKGSIGVSCPNVEVKLADNTCVCSKRDLNIAVVIGIDRLGCTSKLSQLEAGVVGIGDL